MKNIHIRKIADQWQVRVEHMTTSHISNINKNVAVQKAAALARKLFSTARLIIHGTDGRILEERKINSQDNQ